MASRRPSFPTARTRYCVEDGSANPPPGRSSGRTLLEVTYTADLEVVGQWLTTHADVDLGFDCESRPTFHAGQTTPVATLQLATLASALVVQLNALPPAPPPPGTPAAAGGDALLAVLTGDAGRTLCGMGIGSDVRGCHAALAQQLRVPLQPPNSGGGGRRGPRLSELKTFGQSRGVNVPGGLQGLMQHLRPDVGKWKSKRITMSNWARWPLTQEQVRYAAFDAWASLACHEALAALPRARSPTRGHDAGGAAAGGSSPARPRRDASRSRSPEGRAGGGAPGSSGRGGDSRSAALLRGALSEYVDPSIFFGDDDGGGGGGGGSSSSAAAMPSPPQAALPLAARSSPSPERTYTLDECASQLRAALDAVGGRRLPTALVQWLFPRRLQAAAGCASFADFVAGCELQLAQPPHEGVCLPGSSAAGAAADDGLFSPSLSSLSLALSVDELRALLALLAELRPGGSFERGWPGVLPRAWRPRTFVNDARGLALACGLTVRDVPTQGTYEVDL